MELSASRRGIDKTREQFEHIMGCVKEGLARGLSPEQIVATYALDVSPATICRWMEEGCAGTGNIGLRREVSYKPRKKKAAPRSTSHGAKRSYAAFLGLGEEERPSACEMDTAIGRVHGSKCLLTLYLRPCRFQLMLLLGGKTAEEAARALDALEEAVGMDGFGRLFDPILTDNGAELSDHGLIERSAGDSAARRARVFYCDVRQSQQKGSCERNHVEPRKVLPKGTSFDGLTRAGCALLMSHVNSEPRPSLQQDASRCLWQPLCAPAPRQGAIPSALSSASDLCIRKEAWDAASSQAPASVHYTAVCIYSRRSTPLTRRSKSSAWSFASSRTLSWPKPALPLWLAASVRPKTFMPRACAMMTSFTVDMPT